MKNKGYMMFALINFYSCQSSIKAKFGITNKTEISIDSINIKCFDQNSNSIFLKLEPRQSETYWVDMTDLPKVDGDYLLTYKDSIIHYHRFGYFTNGFPMEEVTNISFPQSHLKGTLKA